MITQRWRTRLQRWRARFLFLRCAFIVLRQRALKPHLVEERERERSILRGALPKRLCFLTLVAARKGMVAQEDGDQALKLLGLGVGCASFPILHAAPMHAKLFREFDLGERYPCA